MLDIKLPKKLENEYDSIKDEFNLIRDDWKKYNDEIIPEDKGFAKRIIRFMLDVIDYILLKYENIDIQKYREFLANYDYEFFYGPNRDDSNYLNFDEKLEGENVTEFCWKLKDDEFKMTKSELKKIRAKYSRVLSLF